MARKAAEQGYDVVCAMGGDGTVNEVINGIAGTGAALAVIPAGTGNDFAGALGVPKGDVAAACRILARGHLRPMDLCRVNDRYFASSFGAGFDARVTKAANERFKRLGGIWTYIFAVMSVIWSFRPGRMRIVADGREISKSPLLVAVTNWKSYGGGMYICPGAEIDDGLFDVCIVDNVHTQVSIQLPPGDPRHSCEYAGGGDIPGAVSAHLVFADGDISCGWRGV